MHITVNDRSISIHVRCNRRAKRISLKFDHALERVILTVPHGLPTAMALDFVNDSKTWIASQIEKKPETIPFAEGAIVPVFDVPHVIRFHRGDFPGATLKSHKSEILVAGFDPVVIPTMINNCLQELLHDRLVEKSHQFANKIDKSVNSIKIKEVRRQWGSCSSKGTLSFSKRLAFAPLTVVDYVCAHEVAHLEEMNHSRRFWQIVASLSPNYKAHIKWLKDNGPKLFQYG